MYSTRCLEGNNQIFRYFRVNVLTLQDESTVISNYIKELLLTTENETLVLNVKQLSIINFNIHNLKSLPA